MWSKDPEATNFENIFVLRNISGYSKCLSFDQGRGTISTQRAKRFKFSKQVKIAQ